MRKFVVGTLAVFVLTVAVGVWLTYRTLPDRQGTYSGIGVAAPVTIRFDGFGVPTISGASELDLIRAQGWVVARDRFFQMDLIRRRTEGRLAEILGEALVPSDRKRKVYGFSRIADAAVGKMTRERRAVLDAYAEGVSAFLREGPMPPEIRALGYTPDRWTARDSVLVVLSMFDPPSNDGERILTEARAKLPPALVEFLSADFGFLDAPIVKVAADPPPLRLPAKSLFNLRGHSADASPAIAPKSPRPTSGSNAWAIAGSRTQSGKPVLAGDPHLGLNVPNVWYRLRLEGAGFAVTGVTIPGIPGVILGSNGRVAWTFTNPFADQVDYVLLPPAAKLTTRRERIAIKGKAPLEVEVEDSEWGPVIREEGFAPYGLQWVALDPGPLARMDVLQLDRAGDLPSLLDALSHWTGPAQNAIFATGDGHIGWTVVGNLPNRLGFDGTHGVTRKEGRRWAGYHPFAALPKVIDPPSGFLVSANQRPVPADRNVHKFGVDWPSPTRAFRIEELLAARKEWNVAGVAQVQLDIRSPLHLWYRDRLVDTLKPGGGADDEWVRAVQAIAKDWDGNAATDSAGYPLVREFRLRLHAALFDPFLDVIGTGLRDAARERLSRDAVARALLAERPEYLLSPKYADYDAVVREAAVGAAKSLAGSPGALAAVQWGPRNRARIRHPFSFVLPGFLGPLVNMPTDPQAGDQTTVRAAEPEHGASLRMIVDLAEAGRSLYAQPAGQSGHFLSPHYRDQHAEWARGKYTAFEPGARVTEVVLRN